MSKHRIFKESEKSLESQLKVSNKTIVHNVFAVPVLTPTMRGILDWSKEEVQQVDIKTRKAMAMTGSLHKRSDIGRLYTARKQGGRGLTSVEDIFTHTQNNNDRKSFLEKVYEHEQLRLFRVANEFKE